MGRRYPVQPVHLDFDSEEVRSKIREGASPLRLYTCALAEQIAAKYVCMEGPICDIGCSSGSHFRFFENCGAGHIYLGLDVSSNPSWRSQHASGSNIPCRFTQMSAVDLGLASNSLAFVFSCNALEHVPNIQRVIREMARAMRPGACRLHIVPGVWSLFLYMFHGYRRFSPQGLADLFQQVGLEVAQIWSLGGLPSFALHFVWITWLETGKVYDWIAVSRVPGLMRKILRVGRKMRQGKGLGLYSRLLTISLRLDQVLPFAPAGYAVLIRKEA